MREMNAVVAVGRFSFSSHCFQHFLAIPQSIPITNLMASISFLPSSKPPAVPLLHPLLPPRVLYFTSLHSTRVHIKQTVSQLSSTFLHRMIPSLLLLTSPAVEDAWIAASLSPQPCRHPIHPSIIRRVHRSADSASLAYCGHRYRYRALLSFCSSPA